jgi:hypothetical protein
MPFIDIWQKTAHVRMMFGFVPNNTHAEAVCMSRFLPK